MTAAFDAMVRYFRKHLPPPVEVERPRHGLAQFDRIYIDRAGTRHILDGSAGHSYGSGFHHGFREGCIACREGVVDTADLPRRFPE